jgi:hypothetical protein
MTTAEPQSTKGFNVRKHLKVVLVVSGVLLISGGATAGAASLISGSQIKKNSIPLDRLSKGTQNKIKGVSGQSVTPGPRGPAGVNGENGANGINGAKGDTGATGAKGDKGDTGAKGNTGADGASGVTNLESDGPYPGRSDPANNLSGNQGAQSTLAWVGNNGSTLQQSWVKCAPGKTALGGGFGDNDGGGQDKLNVVTSAPAQVDGTGAITYAPIAGDAAGSFVPNAWLVEGYNNNTSGEIIVRPHVICAEVN